MFKLSEAHTIRMIKLLLHLEKEVAAKLLHKQIISSYTIRFQNTGTDTAFNIRIDDDIDTTKFDLSGLHIISASHPNYYADILANQRISFYFDDILLPDSNTNLAASQGFIKFELPIKEGLAVGTEIRQ